VFEKTFLRVERSILYPRIVYTNLWASVKPLVAVDKTTLGALLTGKALRACEARYAMQQRGETPKQWQGIHKALAMHKPASAVTPPRLMPTNGGTRVCEAMLVTSAGSLSNRRPTSWAFPRLIYL
jgi:hypothetical protein